MLDRITKDMAAARKQRDSTKVKALAMLKSKLLYNSKAPKPKDDMSIVRTYLKQIQESCICLGEACMGEQGLPMAHNKSLMDKYEREIMELHAEQDIIKQYLPEEIGEDAVNEMIEQALKDMGDEPKFGAVMGKVMKIANGRANGGIVKSLVEQRLREKTLISVDYELT